MNETPWIDAWIRWERNSKETYNQEEEEEDDNEPEALAAPTETYRFRYTRRSAEGESDDGDDDGDHRQQQQLIDLEFKGFDSDSEQIWNSTGLTLWRSSHHLCEYLVEHQTDLFVPPPRVLEVGSGLGRCGLLVHHLSPSSSVVLTDGDTDTLKQLRANVEHNRLNDNVSCRQLLWGRDTALAFLQQSSSADNPQFDLILGSDLVYVPSVIRPLFETVETLLANNGKFIMAHCNRREGSSVTVSMILEHASGGGFASEVLMEDDDISIFEFRIQERTNSEKELAGA